MSKTELRKLPANIWILGVAALLTDTSSEMIHSLLPLFLVAALHASVMTVGIIEGIAESIATVTKLFSGTLSDFIGKRKILVVAGYGLSALSKPLFALAESAGFVLLARSVDRVGKGVRGAPRDALIADTVPAEQRGAAYGLRQSMDTIGAVLGPGAALVLMYVTAQNFRFIFWCAVIPGMFAALLLAFGLKEPPPAKDAAAAPTKAAKAIKWDNLKKMGRDYWFLLAVAIFFNLGNSSDAFLLLRAKQVGVPSAMVPLTLVLMNMIYAVCAYPAGILSDRIGRFGIFTVSLLLYATTYLGFALTHAEWQIWLLFIVYGFYLGISQGLLSAMVADLVPADQRGTAFGFISLASGLTLLPASLAAGYLWDNVSPSAPFFFAAGFALMAAFAMLIAFHRRFQTGETKQ